MTFIQAINQALHQAMSSDPSVVCYGLGVDDPRAIFLTTKGLKEAFGSERVFDMPTSENAMTGVAIGLALGGFRPVMAHQRLDFFLLAMDQLVNNAAKWHYMFGGQRSVPITIRLMIGRGWGQGPTHSQSLHAWFSHIPGLKVVMPATVEDAKGLLLASIFDNNPVVFLEHRWLHNMEGSVPEGSELIPLGKAKVLREGCSMTIVAMSYMVIEALRVVDYLKEFDIYCELIDLRTVSPLDWETVFKSVRKTGALLALDIGCATGSVAGEIVARVSMECWDDLRLKPERLALPDVPEPTSFNLTKDFHPGTQEIIAKINIMLGSSVSVKSLADQRVWPHDVPGDWFKGPF